MPSLCGSTEWIPYEQTVPAEVDAPNLTLSGRSQLYVQYYGAAPSVRSRYSGPRGLMFSYSLNLLKLRFKATDVSFDAAFPRTCFYGWIFMRGLGSLRHPGKEFGIPNPTL